MLNILIFLGNTVKTLGMRTMITFSSILFSHILFFALFAWIKTIDAFSVWSVITLIWLFWFWRLFFFNFLLGFLFLYFDKYFGSVFELFVWTDGGARSKLHKFFFIERNRNAVVLDWKLRSNLFVEISNSFWGVYFDSQHSFRMLNS